jgi:N-methylhydantoinase B
MIGKSPVTIKASGKTHNVDPITLEVICEGLIAVVREMRASIIRASYSSVIYEFDDFSCALFGPDGYLVAQSWDHPGHVLPLPWGVRCALDDFSSNLHPGDIILLNDPYHGGTHLNDVTLLFPIFDQNDKLQIFPAVRSHWVDVGGMVPGSYSGRSTNIYQEGVRIPPIKIYDRGKPNEAALALLWANMRVPEERKGDLNAMIGACRIADRRISALIKKYGWDTVTNAVSTNLDRTERRLREQIVKLPSGEYFYEDYLEFFDDGRFDPVIAKLKLTIAGDQITADFDGTNPQVPGVVNCSLAVAGAGMFVAMKSTLDPGGWVNEGSFRPLTLKAPDKTIFNVKLDAPAGAHGEVRKRAVSLGLGALSQIRPDLVSGDLCGSSFPNSIGGFNKRRNRQYVYYEAPAGGNGGFKEADGSSAFANVDFGNLPTIQNAESIENEMPLLVESSALRTDSGGEGQSRGGVGIRRKIQLLDDEGSYSVLSDRAVIPPYGMLGAGSGKPYHVSIVRGGDTLTFDTPGKVSGYPIRHGDVVVIESSGGGGYGDPLNRDPDRVRADVAHGYISSDRARDGYGTVLRSDGAVDFAATEALRARMRGDRTTFKVMLDAEYQPYAGQKGRHRIVELSATDTAKLGAKKDDLVELVGKNPAPLRAWVRIAQTDRDLVVRLDPFAAQILGVDDGDEVRIRVLTMPHLPRGITS